MSDYEFCLPWPPTVNHFHQPVVIKGRARNIKSSKVKVYQKDVASIMQDLKLDGEMIKQKVLIYLTLHPKTNHKYDCSNFLKAYEDALVQCGFIEDDHWIEYKGIRKASKIPGGLIKIKVQLIND